MEEWYCRISSKITPSCLHTAGSGLSNPHVAEVEGNFGRSFLPFGTGDLAAALTDISCSLSEPGRWHVDPLNFTTGSDKNPELKKSSADHCAAFAQVLGFSLSQGN